MAKFLDSSGLSTVFSIIKRHIPTKTSDLTNDSGFITDAGVTSFNGSTGDVTYTAPVTSVNGATGAVSLDADDIPYNGSQSVYEKIDDIVTQGGEPNVIETVEQNGTPLTVTNKTVNVIVPTATSDLTNDSNYVSDANYVHTDNNYTTTEKNKLSGIASGAEVNVQSDWNVSDNTSDAYIKNKPTIPTVNNATLTIQKNSATVNTFTANASTDVTVDISVPTKTSDLTNDSDFVSDASYTHIDVVDTYSSSGTDAISGTGVADALATLDSSVSAETNKAISAITITDGKITANSKISVPTVVDTYSSTGTEAVSGKGVAAALGTLDSSVSAETNKAISAITITDGKISANSKISIPTATSDLTNDSDYVSDASYVHTDNNYTTTDKNKLAGIASGAEVNVQSNWTQTDNTKDDFIKNKPSIPSKTSDLTNDSGYITSAGAPVQSVNGQTGIVSLSIPTASSTAPVMDGIVSPGVADTFSRSDHVHPTDTSRAEAFVITGTAVGGTTIITLNYDYDTILYRIGIGASAVLKVGNYVFPFLGGVNYNNTTYLSFGVTAYMGGSVVTSGYLLPEGEASSTATFVENLGTVPTAVSQLTNDSGYLTSSNAVTSFNGSTGAVTYTAPVTSVNSETGAVVLDATDIAYDSNNTVKEKIDAIISGGGEPNVIEVVEVNGTALTVTDKTVDVPVPIESTVAGWGFTKNTGTYSKPSTGIPKTDLASGVQDSLDLADTAVQTETDPTVPSWAKASSKPSYSGSIADATTGISIADHSTTTIYGVDSSTTTASKVTVSGGNGSAPTLGTAFTIPNVTAVGSGSFTQGAFSGGSFSATVTDHEMSFSFTAATHGTDSHTHVAPTLGTAFTVPNVTSVGSASTWSISASDVTVPIKDVTSTTVVTSKTHTVTDNGHTHTITIS